MDEPHCEAASARSGHRELHLPLGGRRVAKPRSRRDRQDVGSGRQILQREPRRVAVAAAAPLKLRRVARLVGLEHHLALVGRHGRRDVDLVRRRRLVVVHLGEERDLVVLREAARRDRADRAAPAGAPRRGGPSARRRPTPTSGRCRSSRTAASRNRARRDRRAPTRRCRRRGRARRRGPGSGPAAARRG